jgi:transposase
MTPEDEIAALKAENARLREQVETLGALVQELQARLAKDSHNSGKPPSSDELGRKTRSLRKRSGKKPGGQLGHRGKTLHLVRAPTAGPLTASTQPVGRGCATFIISAS